MTRGSTNQNSNHPSSKPAKTVFQLESCVVRPWTKRDAKLLACVANDPKADCFSRNTFRRPCTIKNAETWIANARMAPEHLDFAIAKSGIAIGGISLKQKGGKRHQTMEVCYFMKRNEWVSSRMTEILMAISNWAFATFESLVRLEVEALHESLSCRTILEQAGFQFEAVHRKTVDQAGVAKHTAWFCKFRQENGVVL